MSQATAARASADNGEASGEEQTAWSVARQRLRRWSFWLLLGVLLIAAVLVQLLRSPPADREDLSPANPAPNGAMAVAEVLRQQGVEVIATDSLDETLGALADGSTLLFHDANSYLEPEQLARLSDHGGRTVLVRPGFQQLQELAPEVTAAGRVPEEGGPLTAECMTNDDGAGSPAPDEQDSDTQPAGSITRGGLGYRGPVMCFTFDTGAEPAASYVTSADGGTVVLGAGHILSNEEIVNRGNAALALNTLGSADRLVWYRPSLSDLAVPEEPQSPLALLPAWVTPVTLWLLAVGVLTMLWQGRRLGKLIQEPLPVVVPAAETAAGRARLYQDSKSIRRAAANLRAATLTRLAAKLRLGAGSSAAAVVDAVARRSNRPAVELDRLLRTYLPESESQLVDWAQNLHSLEKEILDQ
ncbi:DUF4350 domain-containing protein [Crystallibacter degradans]|uniref:DUF4350 domain-containing protein n=1 Tax=Crystallibacter degradans TaxID=2726743 RepID=UPI0014750FA7|nr:DUF4350 domain-containing protein [Arthrobacter sp. SF27]NMR29897.1 DUF4350 domain-containing protein [Arthrobacter sp. SF27]